MNQANIINMLTKILAEGKSKIKSIYQRAVGEHSLPDYGPVNSMNRTVQTCIPGGVGRRINSLKYYDNKMKTSLFLPLHCRFCHEKGACKKEARNAKTESALHSWLGLA